MASKKRGESSTSQLNLAALRKKLQAEQAALDSLKNVKAPQVNDDTKEGLEKPYERSSSAVIYSKDSYVDSVSKVADLIRQGKTAKQQEKQVSASLDAVSKKKLDSRIREYQKLFQMVEKEIGKIVIGQKAAVKGFLRALIADGHVLVEGVPGVAKTTLIRALAQTTGCSFARIQFTPDLLPTDIIGISTYQEGRGFYTLKGPIFNNFILADEINRAPPKVQSALLESMAEKQATIAKESFPVPLPFFTMATQNPLENVGTYSLPEAQVDRFLFKIFMGYPSIDEEQLVLRSNINFKKFTDFDIKPLLNPDTIIQIQEDAKLIYVDKKVERYIVHLIDATRYPKKYKVPLGKYVEYGSSPRGSIGLFNAARAEALLCGQSYVTPQHVKSIVAEVLRHRIILSYEGQAEGISTDAVVSEILRHVPVP